MSGTSRRNRTANEDIPTAWGVLPPALPEAGEESSWALVAYFGPIQGQVFPLSAGTFTLGRGDEASLRLADDLVSRRHATLTVAQGEVVLEDLGSTNGTWINAHRLQGAKRLVAGDRIRMGAQVFKLAAMDALDWAFHRALRDGATLDPLTALPNRRTALEALEKAFALGRKHGVPVTAAIADLDHFKGINDEHGHAAGDAALKAFAARAGALVQPEDTLGRIGGEEFLLVLPYSDKTVARRTLERIRWAVASQPVSLVIGDVPLTCSFGLAQLLPGDPDPMAWLARADAALYRAKAAGRNRVCEG